MGKLTKRSVDALQATEKRFTVWDDVLPGFGCRVTPDCKKTFVVDFTVNARRRRMTLGHHGIITVDQARKMAREALAAASMGKDPMAARDEARADISLSELCELYLEEGVGHKRESTVEIDKGRIERHIKPLLGSKPVRQITQRDVQRMFNDIAKGKTATIKKSSKKHGLARVRGGEGTARRAVGLLGGIFTYAIKQGMRPDNPAHGIEKGKDERRERFLTSEEIQRLTKTMNAMEKAKELHPYSVAIVRLLLFTGARRGEITNARWEDVDLERGVLVVPKGKTGPRNIRLAAPAQQILSDLPRASDWVFPARSGDKPFQGLPKQWRTLRERAKLGELRIHDLRHTFASMAVQGGASLYLVQNLLGHSDASMTQRYAHLADDPVSAANDAVAKRVAELFSGGPKEIEFVHPVKGRGEQ